MGFISKKKTKNVIPSKNDETIERQFASEIVEIFEEKLEELDVTLPGITKNSKDEERRIKTTVRNELIAEVEDFIYSNKKTLVKIA